MAKKPKLEERRRLLSLLREMRLAAGLRQGDLAERLGQPQSFVSRFESGDRRLDVLEVWQVCEALGVSFSDFAQRLEGKTR